MTVEEPLAPEVHHLADQFPMMTDLEYEALKADIRENGLKDAIVLFEGKILDGRNRHRACLELQIEPRFTGFDGTYEEAAKLSASVNLTRRHLSKSQKAMVIAKNGLAAAPSSGDSEGGKIGIREAAERYGVNHMTIYKAFYVLNGDRGLADKVMKGDLSVGKAESMLRGDLDLVEVLPADTKSVLARITGRLKSVSDPRTQEKALFHLRRALKALERVP